MPRPGPERRLRRPPEVAWQRARVPLPDTCTSPGCGRPVLPISRKMPGDPGRRQTGKHGQEAPARHVPDFVRALDQDATTPPPPRPGLHGPAQLVDREGRTYAAVEAISAKRAQELAQAGAAIVYDPCGCGGYCGLTWFDPQDVNRMVAAGRQTSGAGAAASRSGERRAARFTCSWKTTSSGGTFSDHRPEHRLPIRRRGPCRPT